MIRQNQVRQLSILLTFCAGFCDAATFFSGKSIFSAHITSNFIVFIYDLLNNAPVTAFIKLLPLPVFIVGSVVGGKIYSKTANANNLLIVESLVLLVAGILSLVFDMIGFNSSWGLYVTVFFVVFAMSLQSAYGKLFAASTYGPTTAMTNNVTQLSIDFEKIVEHKGAINWRHFKKQGILVLGFLTGAAIGGLMANEIALTSVIIPAVIILYTYIYLEIYTN